MQYNTIFSQLFQFMPRHRFEKTAGASGSDRYCKHFTAWRQLLTCLYAQITGKDSLREVSDGLLTNRSRLYHLGMEPVAKSTLADAMNRRDPAVFKALFDELLARCTELAPGHGFRFHNPLYAIDSTTIPLCLAVYDWARYRRHKGAVKLHTQLDLSGNLPCYVVMSNGKMADIRAARKWFKMESDSIYTYDKGYCDYAWFKEIDGKGAFFVTRLKQNARLKVVGQHLAPNGKLGVVADDMVELELQNAQETYPGKLRRVMFHDEEANRDYVFLTNNFRLAAATIAAIYKRRWQIELFFKWIKQNLQIKTFLGISENAVMTQIWVALIHFLLVAYIKFLTKVKIGLTEITARLREQLMGNNHLLELLSLDRRTLAKPPDWNSPRQLELFGEFST
jgi:hypothetical protein